MSANKREQNKMKMYVQVKENGFVKQVSRKVLDFVNVNGISIAIHEHATRNSAYTASEMTSGVAVVHGASVELCKRGAIKAANDHGDAIKEQAVKLIYSHLKK